MTPDGAFKHSRPDFRCKATSALRAFTLIELLIVMFIIIILFTMYWSGSSKAFQSRQMSKCERNLQNLYVALRTFSVDNHDQLPVLAQAETSEPVLSQLIPRDTTQTEFFICPGTHDKALPEALPFADARISYAYYMGHTLNDGATQPLISDRQVNTISKAAGQPLFSTDGNKPGNNHNRFGGNVMFCDGNVQRSSPTADFNLTFPTNVILLNPKP